MNFLKFIKQIFLFLLTFLLGTQTSYSKTELVLPQNQVLFSIEQTQNFKSLEKQLQPNIGFLKEKSKFEKPESISAQNQYEFFEQNLSYLADGGDDFIEGFVGVVRRGNADELADATTKIANHRTCLLYTSPSPRD